MTNPAAIDQALTAAGLTGRAQRIGQGTVVLGDPHLPLVTARLLDAALGRRGLHVAADNTTGSGTRYLTVHPTREETP